MAMVDETQIQTRTTEVNLMLSNAMNIARQPGPRDRVNYQILLILTDGGNRSTW